MTKILFRLIFYWAITLLKQIFNVCTVQALFMSSCTHVRVCKSKHFVSISKGVFLLAKKKSINKTWQFNKTSNQNVGHTQEKIANNLFTYILLMRSRIRCSKIFATHTRVSSVPNMWPIKSNLWGNGMSPFCNKKSQILLFFTWIVRNDQSKVNWECEERWQETNWNEEGTLSYVMTRQFISNPWLIQPDIKTKIIWLFILLFLLSS